MVDFVKADEINVYHGITVNLFGLLTTIPCTCVQGMLYTYMYNVHVHIYCVYIVEKWPVHPPVKDIDFTSATAVDLNKEQ